jgi:hypothetical protein
VPRRLDDTFREEEYGGHPPTCTCVECVKRRLAKVQRESKTQTHHSVRRISLPRLRLRFRPNIRLLVPIIGIIGAFALYISLFPVCINSNNQQLFANWWRAIWAVGGIMDYIRAIFVVVAGLLFMRGILGMIISPFKTRSAINYLWVGGLAGLALFLALWSGILNGSFNMQLAAALLGADISELNNRIVWNTAPPGLSQNLVNEMTTWGWLPLTLVGCGIWIIGTFPFSSWWRRLR